jgi:hypothetical protein
MTTNDQILWNHVTETLKNTHKLVSVQSFTAAVLRLNVATGWALDIESEEIRDRAKDIIDDTARYLSDEMGRWGADPE